MAIATGTTAPPPMDWTKRAEISQIRPGEVAHQQ